MLDSNETMAKRTQIQAMIDQVIEIAAEAGLDALTEAVNGVLARLGADVQGLTAVDRDAAALSGLSLRDLAVARARERSIADAAPKVSEADMMALRIFDGDAADPRLVIAQQREAERELQALSHAVRADLARRFDGNVVTMLLRAKSENLL